MLLLSFFVLIVLIYCTYSFIFSLLHKRMFHAQKPVWTEIFLTYFWHTYGNSNLTKSTFFPRSHSTHLLAATTLRNVLGTKHLAEILSERETISHVMEQTLDEATDPWGVKVERVEMWVKRTVYCKFKIWVTFTTMFNSLDLIEMFLGKGL